MVSNIFYFHPYLGKIPNLTNIFQMGWNQLANFIILRGVLKQKNPTIDCPWTRTQASEPSNPWGSSAPYGYTSKHQGGGSFWGGFRWKKQGVCIQRSRDGFVSGYCFSYFFVDWCSFHVVGPPFAFYWGSVDFEPILSKQLRKVKYHHNVSKRHLVHVETYTTTVEDGGDPPVDLVARVELCLLPNGYNDPIYVYWSTLYMLNKIQMCECIMLFLQIHIHLQSSTPNNTSINMHIHVWSMLFP